MGNNEVSEVSLAILISHTPRAFSFGNAGENEIPQCIGICLIHSQRRLKDAGFVLPARMLGIKAVIAKLLDINDRATRIGECHLSSFLCLTS